MIKVAIDISPLKTEHKVRGVGSYTKNLIKALDNIKSQISHLKIEAFDFKAENWRLKTGNYNVVHYPYFDLFFLTLPIKKIGKTIVTIHDVIPLVFPEHYPPGIRGKIKFLIQKFSLKGISAVITDSLNSKKDIVKYLNYPEDKIYVVYLAPGKRFQKLETGNWKLEIRKKYNLPERFVLYVGDINYNKNILGLIRAFVHLPQTANQPPSRLRPAGSKQQKLGLVLVGRAFKDENLSETREIVQLIKVLKLEDRVLCLGWIPEEDLVKIYNLATVYCQPSFYEGFGLPVLEAMACGTPVVAAKTSSLPEICDGAILWIDPSEPQDIASGLRRLLDSTQPAYQSLVKRGFEQVKKFSWEKTAQETVRVYEEMVV